MSTTATPPPRLRLADETSEEFRLLVAEIAEAEGLPWPTAQQVARVRWADLASHDPEEPIPFRPTIDWRFVAWCLFLLLCVSLAILGGLVWVLATAGV